MSLASDTIDAHAGFSQIACPSELWGCVASWLLPVEFLRLCSCNSIFILPQEMQHLWRGFCYARGFARLLDGALDINVCRQGNKWRSGPDIDWQCNFQQNAVAEIQGPGRKYVFAFVVVRTEQIRVPCNASSGHGFRASQHAWLFDHGWIPTATLHEALLRMMCPCEVPLRLRELTAGLPGVLSHSGVFHASSGPASTVVEWPIGRMPDGAWSWRLPPHRSESHLLEVDQKLVVGPHPRDCGKGWLVELVAMKASSMTGSSPSAEWISERSRFVHVGEHRLSSVITVRELCDELVRHLPTLGFYFSSEVYPADICQMLSPMKRLEPQWLLRADLRWTQGEQLRLFEVSLPSRPCWDSSTGGRRPVSTGNAGPHKVVLFHRFAIRLGPGASVQGANQVADVGTDFACSSRGRTEKQHAREIMPTCRGCQGSEGLLVDAVVPHSRRLLVSSIGARQFEFHPTRPGTMLIGRKDGVVTIFNHETDTHTHALEVDPHPIVGLSWFHTQPQLAIVGASQSGATCIIRHDEISPGCMERTDVEPFPRLSSVSANCTDDYFVTSGLSLDLGLTDIATGRRLKTFHGLHQNFINITRFAHRSPHLFATASFDCTCKVWDLREPICANHPVRNFSTDTLNVMCCFAPDDRHVLCSGVDKALQQFGLEKHDNVAGTRFPLPKLRSGDTNYRRAVYCANGALVATAATNESLVRIYTTQAPHGLSGRVDFGGLLGPWRGPTWPPGGGGSGPGDPAAGARPPAEYVQSLRCDPTDPALLAALLSAAPGGPPHASCIATARLGGRRGLS